MLVYEDGMVKIKCAHKDLKDCKSVIFSKLTDVEMTEYEAREIRFHTPSEHTLDGKPVEMEI